MSEERRKKKMLSTDAREVRDVPRWWFEIDIDSSFAYGLGRQGRRVRGGGARIPGMPRWCGIAAICMRRQVVACAAAVSLRAVASVEETTRRRNGGVIMADISSRRGRSSHHVRSLPSFSQFHLGRHGPTGLYRRSSGFTGFHRVSTGFAKSDWLFTWLQQN